MAMDPVLEAALIQMALTGIGDILKAVVSAKSGTTTLDQAKTTIDETVSKLTADLATNDALADAEVKKRFPGS